MKKMSIIKSFFLKHNQYCLYVYTLKNTYLKLWSLFNWGRGIRHRHPSFANHFKDPPFATNDEWPYPDHQHCTKSSWMFNQHLVNQRYLTWLCRLAFMNIYHFFLLPEYSSFFVIASYGANTDHKSLLFGVE